MYRPNSTFHAAVLIVLLGSGCTQTETPPPTGLDTSVDGHRVPILMGEADSERLVRFYVGSLLGGDVADPVSSGLLQKDGDGWYLGNPERAGIASAALLQSLYDDAREEGSLALKAMESFVQENYYAARGFPETLQAWVSQNGMWTEPEWFRLEVKGSMVPQRRITWVRRTDIEAALDSIQALSDPILYPVGTVFVGEHVQGKDVVETTMMRKRGDGLWDYLAYDEAGNLTDIVRKEPRDMLIPTRCTGCHYGNRLFEPERSFPAAAKPGPLGERAVFVPDSWRRSDIVTSIQEHARRSDTVLGLYATLYVAEAATGQSPDPRTSQALLSKFGISHPSR